MGSAVGLNGYGVVNVISVLGFFNENLGVAWWWGVPWILGLGFS